MVPREPGDRAIHEPLALSHDLDLAALVDRLQGRGTDQLTRSEATGDHHRLGLLAQDLDAPQPQAVLLVHHHHLVATAQRRTRQHHAVFEKAAADLRVHEHPHRERRPLGLRAAAVGILDARNGLDHAGARIDLALGAHDGPRPGVLAAGKARAQHHLRPLDLARLSAVVDGQLHEGGFLVGDGQPDLRVVDGVDPRHRAPRPTNCPTSTCFSRTRPAKGASMWLRSRSRRAWLARRERRAPLGRHPLGVHGIVQRGRARHTALGQAAAPFQVGRASASWLSARVSAASARSPPARSHWRRSGPAARPPRRSRRRRGGARPR